MNERDENPLLVEVATTIADGFPVDWETLLAEHPELGDELRELQVLQKVEAARKGGAADPAGGS